MSPEPIAAAGQEQTNANRLPTRKAPTCQLECQLAVRASLRRVGVWRPRGMNALSALIDQSIDRSIDRMIADGNSAVFSVLASNAGYDLYHSVNSRYF